MSGPLLIIGVSLLCGYAGAFLVARFAGRLGLIDIPNERSSHTAPTPRGGGIGIPVAVMATALSAHLHFLFWLPALLLSVASIFDDRWGLRPRTRLILQFLAALAAVVPFWLEPAGPGLLLAASDLIRVLLIFFCAVFMVGTANFYNFMDGINGIAGITGVVGFGLLSAFAGVTMGDPQLALFAGAIAAACLGFLPLNIPRARVFMGDVGSIPLGLLFALLCMKLAGTLADFLLLCGFLFPFYVDALTTLMIRWHDGERLFKAHRRHLYQLLANQLHIPHWQVALGYGGVQAIIGGTLVWLRPWGWVAVFSWEVLLVVCWVLAMVRIRKISGDRPGDAAA
jgi:Fuc2NAc and GlcNAc transferase